MQDKALQVTAELTVSCRKFSTQLLSLQGPQSPPTSTAATQLHTAWSQVRIQLWGVLALSSLHCLALRKVL